jgi:N-acetylmuramoyl-L-alanine amidase
MRKINKCIVHCSDTPAGRDVDIKEIRRWHVEENGWSDVGYHFLIKLDGTIQIGRDIETVGAHTKGENKYSIGICYVGGAKGIDTRTVAQKVSLVYLIGTLKRIYTNIDVFGHRDFTNLKQCPSFDAKHEYKNI